MNLDKACLKHDMAHDNFNFLARGTASEKVLHGEACNIANNSHCD